MGAFLRVFLHVLAWVAASGASNIAEDLTKLSHLLDQGRLTADEFQTAKQNLLHPEHDAAALRSDGDGMVDDSAALLRGDFESMMMDILLGEQHARLIAGIVQGQMAAALRHNDDVIMPSTRRHLQQSTTAEVTCELSSCGSSDVCSSWNKVLDNISDCNKCGTKKYSVNELFECTCAYTCSVPSPEAPAPPAGAEVEKAPADTAGAASANVNGAALWVENGKLAFGAQASVCLFEDPDEGADGLATDKDLRVDGEARRSSAEHLIATKAPRCTATAWILIVAQCSAIP